MKVLFLISSQESWETADSALTMSAYLLCSQESFTMTWTPKTS